MINVYIILPQVFKFKKDKAMADSPINFMMYGHTADYLQSQELKNKLLK